MMLTEEQYRKLYHKRLRGECTEEELEALERYEEDFQLRGMDWDANAMGEMESVKDHILSAVDQKIDQREKPIVRALAKIRYVAAVAALFIVATIVMYRIHTNNVASESTAIVAETIVPGGNKALLTLDDGTVVDLGDAQLGYISADGRLLTNKEEDGRLNYAVLSGKAGGKVQFHTVRTPRGGQYQIALPDGTQVWLNAASSVRFPTGFQGGERRVEVEGEVFFDVKRQVDKPFRVVSGRQTVTVLGTKFNISAYADESAIQTSLIEGKVKLDVGAEAYHLTPGKATVYDTNKNAVQMIPFDERTVLAWQSGYFMFNDEPIEQIMQKIARWYDVQIIYKGDMRAQAFSGRISRFNQVQEVLDMLALTGTIKFRIEGRRIYVMA